MTNQATTHDSIYTVRKFKDDGTLIVLFPFVPWDNSGLYCASYIPQEGHGSACSDLTAETLPATSKEVKEITRHLKSIGYSCLDHRQRINHHKAYKHRVKQIH
jgi:hypothetical protein